MYKTFLLSVLVFTSLYAKSYEARVVFEICSDSTQMKIYRLPAKSQPKKSEILNKGQRNISLNHVEPILENLTCLATKVDYSVFSPEVMDQGISVLNDMKTCAQNGLTLLSETTKDRYETIHYAGIATSAFRSFKQADANKAAEFIERIKKETGISVTIIDNQVESLLGAVAAATTKNLPLKNLIVWDLGDDGWQMNFFDEKGQTEIYSQDGQASQEFLKSVLEAKGLTDAQTRNPNPITRDDVLIHRLTVAGWTKEDLASRVAQKISLSQSAAPKILAIGPVHTQTILPQINAPVAGSPKNSTVYTLQQLQTLIDKYVRRAWNSDEPDSESTVTDAILVEGYMYAWKIPAVDVADANLTEGFARNLNIHTWNDYLITAK